MVLKGPNTPFELMPLVSGVRPLAQAEALHERLERWEITGRAALLVG